MEPRALLAPLVCQAVLAPRGLQAPQERRALPVKKVPKVQLDVMEYRVL